MSWTAETVLQETGLRLTPSEKANILKKMPPPTAEGQIYIDGVFEGGGVRGLAFLGALRCIDDLGLQWRKVAGTSAGAITATLVAAEFAIEELEEIIGGMDFNQFTSQKTSRWILDNDPSDDLRSPQKMILLLLLARRLGEYSSEPFHDWLDETLKQRKMRTFAEIKSLNGVRDLKVVASDVSRGQMLVLPDDLEGAPSQNASQQKSLAEQLELGHRDEFQLAEAVRLSMSIPFFFEPGKLGDRKIVDGGILSNFPLWIYDFQPGANVEKKCPRWPTFGLRLTEQAPPSAPIKSPFDLLGKMFRTMLVARDQYHLNQAKRDRVIEIDITAAQTSATEFNISDEKKTLLYRLGYLSAKQFFLNSWDWEAHLRKRGFNPSDLQA